MLGKLRLDKFVALCSEPRPLEALEVVHLPLGARRRHLLAPVRLLELLREFVRLHRRGDVLLGRSALNLRSEICQSDPLDGQDLAGHLLPVVAADIHENALVVDNVDNNGEFVGVRAKAHHAQAAELDELLEGHGTQKAGQNRLVR